MPIQSSATAFGDGDIPTMLADMAIAVTVNNVTGVGLLDEADEILVQDAERGEVVVLATTLTVRTTDFPNAAIDQAVAIGARNFTIRDRRRIGDGGLTKLVLSLVTVEAYQPSNAPLFAFADDETPAGTLDGVNKTFTLARPPNPAASLELVLNLGTLTQGIDYTLSGVTIVFATAPDSGAVIRAWYRY